MGFKYKYRYSEEDTMNKYEGLMEIALESRERAYAPYSHFKVGAALLADNGIVYVGSNMENASYPAGHCAERGAFATAISHGLRKFDAIAIAGGKEDAEKLELCAPCGVCRQVMREFCDPEEFEVILGTSVTEYEVYKLAELLPKSFGPDDLA